MATACNYGNYIMGIRSNSLITAYAALFTVAGGMLVVSDARSTS
jgi:uncharacterized membrane protein YedE/YeeE